MSMFTGTAIFGLMRQSDALTWCVLGALLIMSIACWTVALYKLTVLKKMRNDINSAQRALEHVTTIEELNAVAAHYDNTAVEALYTRIKELIRHGDGGERLQHVIAGVCDEILMREESGNIILKTSAEAATLLGLLGTIWGLIHSFMRISQEQMADIVTVAPGIAEALITTFMGLLVAIPALILYHAVYRQLQLLEQDLICFSESVERSWYRMHLLVKEK